MINPKYVVSAYLGSSATLGFLSLYLGFFWLAAICSVGILYAVYELNRDDEEDNANRD